MLRRQLLKLIGLAPVAGAAPSLAASAAVPAVIPAALVAPPAQRAASGGAVIFSKDGIFIECFDEHGVKRVSIGTW